MISRKKLNPNWNTHSDFILLAYAKNEASKQTKCQFQIKTFLSRITQPAIECIYCFVHLPSDVCLTTAK